MYKVFNMGHRLEIYLPEAYAQDLIDMAAGYNIPAQVVGRVERSETNRLTIKSPYGEFKY